MGYSTYERRLPSGLIGLVSGLNDQHRQRGADDAHDIPAPATSRAVRVLGPLAAALAMLSAFATFVVLADLSRSRRYLVVVTLLLINALTVFLLVGIIAHEVWLVLQARRRGRAAARLHVQIVSLFAVIAAVPAILVALVASVTLDRGLDRLFSTRTRAIIENSLIVADAYLQEHAQMIRGDIMAMSFDLSRAKPLFDSERERFKQFFTAQARAWIVGCDDHRERHVDHRARRYPV